MISAVKNIKYLFLAFGLLLAGCLQNKPVDEVKEIKGEIFGSYYLVKYRGNLETSTFNEKLNLFFQDFNKQFSTYQSDSVISQFNVAGANSPMVVTPLFISMLELAKKFHTDTEGAFDPTLGPVIKLWGFGGAKKYKTPSDRELEETRKKVGFKFIQWDESKNTVWKTREGVQLDVNAFAPGWASDLIGKMLEQEGIFNYMVDISGEIFFRGQKTDQDYWIAGIEQPSKDYAQGIQLAFRIKNLAIATSGNYRQFFDENNKRFSHIIDPRTGRPVSHNIASTSVITQTAAEADAWSTALMVLGSQGMAIAEKNGIKVFVLDAKSPAAYEEIISPLMKAFIEENRL